MRVTDLGIARVWRPDNSSDTSGTPGYMGNIAHSSLFLLTLLAPEVMCRQNHGVAADYYALGVMVYEFMLGKVSSIVLKPSLKFGSPQRPYLGKSRKEIRDNILAKQVQIKKEDVPAGWSLEAADFANRVENLS